MTLNIKNMTALMISILLIIFFFIYFSIKLTRRNIDNETSKIESPHLETKVKVFTKRNGVKTISSTRTNDAFFALGYIHAKDRLWQMDMNLRKAKGELSEIFGIKYLSYDKFIRSFDIADNAQTLFNSDKVFLDILDSYIKGINNYINNNSENLPYEFGLLSYSPNEWVLKDVFILFKYLALINSSGFKNDLELTYIANNIGVQNLLDLIVDSDDTVYDGNIKINNELLKNNIIDKMESQNAGGSNLFSVNKDSFKNSSILVSDLHNKLTLPNIWYQIELYSNDVNFYGLTIPGLPFPFSARNDSLAWSYANHKSDDLDYFIYQIAENGKEIIGSENNKIKMRFALDTIKVKNLSPVYYYKNFIEDSLSVVVNVDSLFNNKLLLDKYKIISKWTGFHSNSELYNLYQLLKANNCDDFDTILNNWVTPSYVFNSIDYTGNMSQIYCGKIPKRSFLKSLIATPVSQKELSWDGFIKLQDHFNLRNKKTRFFTTANQKFHNKSKFFFGAYYDSKLRNERLKDLVKEADVHDVLDLKVIQNDNYSQYSRILINLTINILENYNEILSKEEKEAIIILKKWDYYLTKDQVAPTIIKQFIKNLKINIFKDDLKENYNMFNNIELILNNKLLEVLNKSQSSFYDDKRTEKIELKNYIILKSFKESIENIINEYSNLEEAKYYKSNKIIIKNELNNYIDFNKMLNLENLSLNGDFSTLNYSRQNNSNTKNELVGVSARVIFELPGDMVYHIISGGSSSEPMSPYYKNQSLLWLNSGYISSKYKSIDESKLKISYQFYPK